MLDAYVQVGRLRRTFGTEGGLRFDLDEEVLDWLSRGDFLFVELDGLKVPYKIASIVTGRNALIRFVDAPDIAHAQELTSAALFVPVKQYDSNTDTSSLSKSDLDSLQGYEIVNINEDRSIGIIEEVREYPGQWVALIPGANDHIIVPLVEAFVDHLDHSTKQLFMNLPEGMIEVQQNQ
jgi:16S rRNA processing protein RimM